VAQLGNIFGGGGAGYNLSMYIIYLYIMYILLFKPLFLHFTCSEKNSGGGL